MPISAVAAQARDAQGRAGSGSLPARAARGVCGSAIFFLVPLVAMLSLVAADRRPGARVHAHLALARATRTAVPALRPVHPLDLVRGRSRRSSRWSSSIPVAYWIAFYGGTRKNFFLLLLLLPFFVSFVIRTLAWQFILSDNGIVLGTLKSWHAAAAELPRPGDAAPRSSPASRTTTCRSWRCRCTSRWSGSTAASSRRPATSTRASRETFTRVILPLSIPGIFAGVPADVRAGGRRLRERADPRRHVEHDDRQRSSRRLYLMNFQDYPAASALSFDPDGGAAGRDLRSTRASSAPGASRSTCERASRDRAGRRPSPPTAARPPSAEAAVVDAARSCRRTRPW